MTNRKKLFQELTFKILLSIKMSTQIKLLDIFLSMQNLISATEYT